jgi:phosphate/sulfate permease
VQWGLVERILWAWVFTMPVCAVISYLVYKAVAGLE